MMSNFMLVTVNGQTKYEYENCIFSRYSGRNGVKYVRCDNCAATAVIRNNVFRLTKFHTCIATRSNYDQLLQDMQYYHDRQAELDFYKRKYEMEHPYEYYCGHPDCDQRHMTFDFYKRKYEMKGHCKYCCNHRNCTHLGEDEIQ
jgi:hypothetical protein